MVETAVSMIAAFTLAFMLFEAAMLIYSYSIINIAAREGVRYAVVHGSDNSNCSGPSTGCGDASGANVIAVVDHYAALTFHDTSAMKVTVSYVDDAQSEQQGYHVGQPGTPLSLVTVTVVYTYVPFVKLVSLSGNLTASSAGRIVF